MFTCCLTSVHIVGPCGQGVTPANEMGPAALTDPVQAPHKSLPGCGRPGVHCSCSASEPVLSSDITPWVAFRFRARLGGDGALGARSAGGMGDTRLEPLVLSDAERRTLNGLARRRRTAQGAGAAGADRAGLR